MATVEQKTLEKFYFDEFIKCYAIPNGDVIHDDKPDFIITGQKVVGIEITNYYKSNGNGKNSEQQQRPIREKVLKIAHEKFTATTNNKIQLSASFYKSIKTENINQIAEKIYNLALRLNPSHGDIVSQFDLEDIPEVNFISYASTTLSSFEWQSIQSYDIKPIDLYRLSSIIDEKDQKKAQYKQCDEYWLLIIIDYFDAAQFDTLDIQSNLKIARKSYTKVIIFIPQTHQVLEL